ncbi:hypothetical protein [Oceanivirga salmonicida]|uniref:hypothetical protein n=1 Tax=Oceanivirga salmonicida TaxID=1769291 RepID=UPI000837A4D6|nr:hypothetical protein [Oceanivirga salmonicida]
MKKLKNFIPAILLILILIYRNMTIDSSSNDEYLVVGLTIIFIRMIFFKMSLNRSMLYVILLSVIGIFYIYIYTHNNINDLITENYILLASIFNLVNILLMLWLIHQNYVFIGMIYLINAVLISVELIPNIANYVEILAISIYIIANIKKIINMKSVKEKAEIKEEKND